MMQFVNVVLVKDETIDRDADDVSERSKECCGVHAFGGFDPHVPDFT